MAAGMTVYEMNGDSLGSHHTEWVQIIEITASEVRLALSGHKNATKEAMIAAMIEQ